MSTDVQDIEPTKLYHCLQGWPPEGPNAFEWKMMRLHRTLQAMTGWEGPRIEVQ
jgi:hypothetical protein